MTVMFKEVTLTGTPYERGLQYGQSCKEEIAVSVRNYQALFALRKKLTWEQAQRLSRRYLPAIRALGDDYIDEMQGIADGAGITFDEVLAINARTELLHTSLSADDLVQECTAFAAMAPATKNGTVLAGQTWDFTLLQRQAVVIVRIPGDGTRPGLLFFPEAGMIGGKGMNSAGLSLTLNALRAKEHGSGLPVHFRMRRILECATLHQAYEQAVRGTMPSAANLMMTHRDGIALDVELDPSGVDVLLPQRGVLVHTNHFIGPKMSLTHDHAGSGSTYIRLQRAQQLFCEKQELTLEDAQAAFRDHKGYPTSICAHPVNPATPVTVDQNATNFGLVMDLTHLEAWLAWGNPCENPFVKISV